MCRPLSGYAAIINGDVKLWISEKTDSHSEISNEFAIRDNGKHRLYAFEFYPNEDNPSPETATWTLNWDSDATLSFRAAPSIDEVLRFRNQIEKAALKYIFRDGSHKTTACRAWVFGTAELEARESSSVEARDSSRVVARGSSSVVAWGSSRVEARGSSRVEARGSSRVVAWESSRVEARGSSRVVALGSSSVEARGSSRVEARGSSRVVAWESSRVEARGSSRVEARGSSRVVAWESSRVEARDSSRVEARDSSSVVARGSSSVVARGSSTTNGYGPKPKELMESAVWIDRTGESPIVLVAESVIA